MRSCSSSKSCGSTCTENGTCVKSAAGQRDWGIPGFSTALMRFPPRIGDDGRCIVKPSSNPGGTALIIDGTIGGAAARTGARQVPSPGVTPPCLQRLEQLQPVLHCAI